MFYFFSIYRKIILQFSNKFQSQTLHAKKENAQSKKMTPAKLRCPTPGASYGGEKKKNASKQARAGARQWGEIFKTPRLGRGLFELRTFVLREKKKKRRWRRRWRFSFFSLPAPFKSQGS